MKQKKEDPFPDRTAISDDGSSDPGRRESIEIFDFHLTILNIYDIVNRRQRYAALAQSVERRLGKAEVGGSSPLGSLENS